jgi:phosphoglycolate phosphatase
MHLVLFDIDGTLITTQGAGMRAFYRAMDDLFGVKVESEVIHPDGKTDPLILRELLQYYNLESLWQDESREAVFASYLRYLDEEMSQAKERGWIRILPGVPDLLDMLSRQSDCCIGLVTGNLEGGARIKLKNAGLDGYFRFGAYGSDSGDRTVITQVGIRRGMQFIAPASVGKAFVIGDTPLDISHGHAAGASVIAVASARYDLNELAEHGPDMLVPDLTSGESILRFMRAAPSIAQRGS